VRERDEGEKEEKEEKGRSIIFIYYRNYYIYPILY